jgi:hypothetical protein
MVAPSRGTRRSPCYGDRVGGCGRSPLSATRPGCIARRNTRQNFSVSLRKSGERDPRCERP